MLLEAAARCRLDGFLLTNLRALGRGEKGYFQAQVDHVLVTTRGVVAVENKYWRGVVFDGTTPESVHSHWAHVIRVPAELDEFAVHLSRESGAPGDGDVALRARLHRGPQAPRAQARRNALFVHNTIAGRGGRQAPWVVPLVFYSHSESTVHTADGAAGRGATSSTPVVTSGEELLDWLRRSLATRRETDVDVVAAWNALARHASEAYEIGGFHAPDPGT